MPRFICSICAAPPEVLAAVNDALSKGESGRAIAARSAFSKSSLYRHREKCLPRETLRKHRDKLLAAAQPGRIIVQWPDDYNGPALTTVQRGSCVPFDEEFKENDVLIVVRFVETPLHEVGNPSALLTEDLRNEAFAEHAKRFPDAKIAGVAAPAVEEVSETNTTQDGICSDAAPCEEFENKGVIHTFKPAQPDPPAPSECEHIMARVAGDISRCQSCGHQTQPDFVVGVSRKWLQERNRDPFRSSLGRFGR